MKLAHVPRGLEAILDLYGDPRDQNGELDIEWYKKNTAIYRLPFTMRTWGDRKTDVFRAHVVVGQVIADCMGALVTSIGVGELRAGGWDFWGGCWWFRPMRGYNALSTHSWGIAVDLNPGKAPQGGKPEDQHPELVRIFKDAGFIWGGDWKTPWTNDAMHFQACSGY